MANVDILGYQSALAINHASTTDLTTLYNSVVSLGLKQYVHINGYGEALGPGSNGFQWTPESVATVVKGGSVFVDWCGWPMYYQVVTETTLGPNQQPRTVTTKNTLGGAGWKAFTQALGASWLEAATFYVPYSDRVWNGGTYSYTRGFPMSVPRYWVGVDQTNLPDGKPVTTSAYSAAIAIKLPSGGAYIYGAGSPNAFGGATLQTLLPTALLAQWIGEVGRGLVHVAPSPTSGSQPKPGSGSTGGGGTSPPSGGGGSTGGSGTTSGSGGGGPTVTCPSGFVNQNGICVPLSSGNGQGTIPTVKAPGINWGEVVGVGAILVAGTTVAVLATHHSPVE